MEGSIALDKLASGQALAILREVQKDVVGKDMAIVKVLMVIVARGHILLEDMPGVGKTTLALAFSKALALDYKRMQFNPDVMPSDITGFSVYDRTGGVLEFKPGAILCNLFLADEINRASSRTQAALLEAMEEGSVTVDGVTHRIPEPFVVIATQNPTGASGTQLLPDSQLDRFMVRFSLGYPAPADELEMLRRKHGSQPVEPVQQVAEGADILRMRQEVRQVYVSDEIYDYVIRLINATRQHPLIGQGGSPRASIAVAQLAQAAAWLQGRDFVIPQEVGVLFSDAVSHRLLLNQQGKAQGVTSRQLAQEILEQTPAPKLR